jgi:DNA-binding MarR family transcriptional regulator
MTGCSEKKVGAWAALVRTQRTALAAVDRRLKEDGYPSLEWYDVLLELERGGPLRPRDLQNRLLFAQYNLSRLIDRMESAGLVERTPCPDDARCQWIKVTNQGRKLRKKMWPAYAAAVNQLFDKLSDHEAEQMADLLRRARPVTT